MARRILVLEDEEAISGMIAMNLNAAGIGPGTTPMTWPFWT